MFVAQAFICMFYHYVNNYCRENVLLVLLILVLFLIVLFFWNIFPEVRYLVIYLFIAVVLDAAWVVVLRFVYIIAKIFFQASHVYVSCIVYRCLLSINFQSVVSKKRMFRYLELQASYTCLDCRLSLHSLFMTNKKLLKCCAAFSNIQYLNIQDTDVWKFFNESNIWFRYFELIVWGCSCCSHLPPLLHLHHRHQIPASEWWMSCHQYHNCISQVGTAQLAQEA